MGAEKRDVAVFAFIKEGFIRFDPEEMTADQFHDNPAFRRACTKKMGLSLKIKNLSALLTALKKKFPSAGWIEVVFSSFNFRLRLEALGKFIYCLKKHEL